ncbi:Aminopeptidase N [Camelus dromedarius]|uniref:Aminopeptidase n=1 Tax=Camelus dromedarius TaxID=9838 RepID=A0A5N4CE43_CAMDR|nr:Aminopeptidase N [Camelus dromedarius]
MGKGFYISKALGILGILLGVAAVATIIALSVVYAQEKNKNAECATVAPSTTPSTTPSTSSATTLDQSKPWNQYRLPTTLLPDSYNVKLRPYLTPNDKGLYIFKGTSTVRFICKEPTNVIIIHSKKLNYTTTQEHMVVLRGVGGTQAPSIDRTELVELTQYLVVHLKGSLEAGRMYEMDAEFEGELADDLAGFYRSEYMEGNVKKVLATTQMQAPDARKSFPCFDEPAMKATFNITLIHPKDLTALSNMLPKGPSVPLEGDPNWNVTEFETTPKMSTYLLAFIVSEFTCVEGKSANDVLIRIWARPNATAEGHGIYALNKTGPILDFFAHHYATSYPLPKSDQIALPDFNAGAMENWGLVTYRENALLFDPLSSSISNKERVVTVIAHELAHQWFGNLVTLAWWNDLWLNEGFASYVEYLGADYAEPNWNLKDLIVTNDVYPVMAVDALASSHPLTTPAEEVNTPAQISEMFDTISYSKVLPSLRAGPETVGGIRKEGASVIRMLSDFLTEELFKKGLASYLNAFAYQNTTYLDLWEHLQKAVNNQTSIQLPDTVRAIMDRWTLQMGFPVITVDTKTGDISQKHFLLDPDSNVTRPSEFNYLWIVPISSIRNGTPQAHYWLQGQEKGTEEIKVKDNLFKTGTNEWVLLNVNVTGYYQVNYDDNNWRMIQSQLQIDPSAIPVINRAQVIYDGFNLANAHIVSVTLALNNTLFLNKETEYMPWQAALNSLSYFKLMFDRSEVYGPMKKYLRKQVEPLFQHFESITKNWTERPQNLMDQYNEINAISTACSNGLSKCEELAKTLFNNWMKDPENNPIHPNLRSTIYCNAIAQGGQEEWDFAWKQFQKAQLVNEADKLRSGLACSNEVWLLNRYLSYTLNPDLIRKQDATSTINSIASNVIGQPLAWDFVQSNWKKLFQEDRAWRSELSFSWQLEQFKQNNMDVGFGSGTRALEQALEKTKANIKWVKENKEVVLQWFTENS